MRISDGAKRIVEMDHGTGYLHELGTPQPVRRYSKPPIAPSYLDYAAIMLRWQSTGRVRTLAETLGVNYASLERLDTGYCDERGWAFPMHDAKREVIGIRLRAEDGHKFALNGSRSGVFIPRGIDSRSTLLICEGPTDTAAALTLGFTAIGRPSNSGGTEIICDILQAGRRRDVVIVADSDKPGKWGAKRLADRIVGLCGDVRVIRPLLHKDLRQWLCSGCTAESIRQTIAAR
jgi:hypothetical protein